MKYSDARPSIKSGDVLAWSHRGWKTWYDIKLQVVRMWTRSEYCHVGIAWVVGSRVFVLEAVSTGVQIVPLSGLLPCYWISLKAFPFTEEVLTDALWHVKSPYSYWQALLAGLHLKERIMDTKWQCAEYVQYILGNAGYEFLSEETPAATVRELNEKYDGAPIWLNP